MNVKRHRSGEENREPVEEANKSEGIAPSGPESSVALPTDQVVLDAGEYMRFIPTRLQRAKNRHQAKKRSGSWHAPRSRKRRRQAKCGLTPS
ncbi:hypothetical protein PI125_g25632 [Phytophthora idaei]|nr:hypothetical protein PI125_g25632 [Phytophthora idaei]